MWHARLKIELFSKSAPTAAAIQVIRGGDQLLDRGVQGLYSAVHEQGGRISCAVLCGAPHLLLDDVVRGVVMRSSPYMTLTTSCELI